MRVPVLVGAILTLGLVLAASAAPLGGRPDLDQLAGVFRHRFANGDISGDKYISEDILEVVKLSPETAYFRIQTEFYNGHSCALWGVAELKEDALVYTRRNDGNSPCVLKFRTNRTGVSFDDVGGYCRAGHCGERGGFGLGEQIDFKFSEKRRIRYLDRLLQSREYAEAVTEHGGTGQGRR